MFAVACTLAAASSFYGYMLVQTDGRWSAPLDDVFIHFDYARAWARGYPFQWSEGNGYSSGNTSVLYPVVLALGYLAGFRGPRLMLWAAAVACAGIVGCLVAARRLVDGATLWRGAPPRGAWKKYLLPPALLSLGALDWTLLSGMENALHLGVWGLCVALALRRPCGARAARRGAWWLGLAGAALVASRPESVVCVAAFGVFACWAFGRGAAGPSARWRGRAFVLAATLSPGAVLLLAQAAANRALTGEWMASGAISKLLPNNPFLTRSEIWERYDFLLHYIVDRLTEHHFTDDPRWAYLVPAVAAVPLVVRRTRPVALLLWSQVVLWLLLVALNHQLRWHNERYAMPAVAWLLLLAAMGFGELLARGRPGRLGAARRAGWSLRAATALVAAGTFWVHQRPNMRDQIWFFGRACRNVLDQHVTAGLLVRKLQARRVLVGDAGAITYSADLPGLDLIGLGGYRRYPFARSAVNGLGASFELIERIPPVERPDVMAIYPSWWGDLPTYFGQYVAAVPAPGNVICGGLEKVIYRADWTPLDRSGRPRTLRPGERVADELDVADLLSEREHGYRTVDCEAAAGEHVGHVAYRLLGDPAAGRRDLFDAGRRIAPGCADGAGAARTGAGRGRWRPAPDVASHAPQPALAGAWRRAARGARRALRAQLDAAG
ncbi:MAG: hypothetical protein HY744_08415 [Deltaproteobacteria bacterium]|nr:hypothetical protein [Deltaproteobacteria bacterium]